MSTTLILISAGVLIATWMFSGTIPMVIYFGMQYISPEHILVIACIGSVIIATMTGTSWGAAGTVGVAFMGIVTVPLIPWSMAGVYMASTLDVSVLDFAPWAVFCYVGWIFAIIYGYTGIGITKDETPISDKETQKHPAMAK